MALAVVYLAAPAAAQIPAAPDPTGADAVFLTVDSVVIQGVGEATLSEEEVLDVTIDLAKVAGGWTAMRDGAPRFRWKIRELSGRGLRLYGSALRAIVEGVSFAHYARGYSGVRVDVRGGAVVRRFGGDPLRNLVIELRRERNAGQRQWPLPAAPERLGPDAVLLTVRSVAIEGTQALGVSENDLLRLRVDLAWDPAQIPAGYVAPGFGLPSVELALWELGRFPARPFVGPRAPRGLGVQLYGSAVQQILGRIAKELHRRGVYGVTIDVERRGVRRLSTPGADGLLVIEVRRD